jgi:hypothetical protein
VCPSIHAVELVTFAGLLKYVGIASPLLGEVQSKASWSLSVQWLSNPLLYPNLYDGSFVANTTHVGAITNGIGIKYMKSIIDFI